MQKQKKKGRNPKKWSNKILMKDLELSENEVFAFALGEIIIFQKI